MCWSQPINTILDCKTNKQTKILLKKPMKPTCFWKRKWELTDTQGRAVRSEGDFLLFNLCSHSTSCRLRRSDERAWAAAVSGTGGWRDTGRREEKLEEKVDKKGGEVEKAAKVKTRNSKKSKRGQIKEERRGVRENIRLPRNEHFLSVSGQRKRCKIQFQVSGEKW